MRLLSIAMGRAIVPKLLLIVSSGFSVVACDAAEPSASGTVRPANDVHPGVEQFGKLVGNWHIKQQVLQQDGSWQSVDDADWRFEYALGGHAIQDQWIQPPLSSELGDGETRQFGTNLRIYDSENDRWNIIWASSDQPIFTSYVATANDDGELVMLGDDPERPSVTQKITYFDISENGWHWKLEFSNDGENWLEVARIRGTKQQKK